MSTNQPTKPKGTPVGGQFDRTLGGGAAATLGDENPDQFADAQNTGQCHEFTPDNQELAEIRNAITQLSKYEFDESDEKFENEELDSFLSYGNESDPSFGYSVEVNVCKPAVDANEWLDMALNSKDEVKGFIAKAQRTIAELGSPRTNIYVTDGVEGEWSTTLGRDVTAKQIKLNPDPHSPAVIEKNGHYFWNHYSNAFAYVFDNAKRDGYAGGVLDFLQDCPPNPDFWDGDNADVSHQ